MLIMVPLPPSWPRIDDLLLMMALLDLANLEMLWSLLVSKVHTQLVTLIVYEGLVFATDEVMWL